MGGWGAHLARLFLEGIPLVLHDHLHHHYHVHQTLHVAHGHSNLPLSIFLLGRMSGLEDGLPKAGEEEEGGRWILVVFVGVLVFWLR